MSLIQCHLNEGWGASSSRTIFGLFRRSTVVPDPDPDHDLVER
jgi:hypothetical protein